MNILIRAIYNRMLMATILVLLAAVLCAIIYMKENGSRNSTDAVSTVFESYKNSEGQQLFKSKCASCHHPLKDQAGPALQGFQQRFPMELFYDFMNEPEKTIKKSKYLKGLKRRFGGLAHPSFSSLGKAQIDSIVDYITNIKNTSGF